MSGVEETFIDHGTMCDITVSGEEVEVLGRIEALKRTYPAMPYDGHVCSKTKDQNGKMMVLFRWRTAD